MMKSDYSDRPHFLLYSVFAGCLVLLGLALIFPVHLPIGASFWDTYIYIDGAHRLSVGQEIYEDFHAPVGPLNYILFNLLSSLFPHGNVALIIQWSMMLVTAPVMATICWFALERGRFAAFALLLPYLIFSILPFNTLTWNAFPGIDGFAYYNRHSAVLLYLTVASLFFVRSQLALTGLLSVLLLTLAFTKINGFAAAGLILFAALCAHRIGLRTSAAVAVICLASTALVEALTGSVSAYLNSVMRLLARNDGDLLPKLVTTVSAHFDAIVVASLLALYLFVVGRRGGGDLVAEFDGDFPRTPAPNRLDRDWLWLGVLIVANTLFESQNYGGLGFISLWPFLLALFLAQAPAKLVPLSPVIVLIALLALPKATEILHSGVRAAATSVRDVEIETEHLPPRMRFSAKALTVAAAQKSRPILASGRHIYQKYAEAEILPAYWLYFDHRFQVNVLETMDDVIGAIHQREAETGHRYEVIDVRDFANPITAIMGRTPARGVSIGGDPYRTVLPLTDREADLLSDTDIVLIPTCPVTSARLKLLADYAKAYAGFNLIELTECFQALEHPRFTSG